MSMISGLIDELRNAAEFYDGFKAADLMRDAADTILELRDDLQRANAENAKLRELCEDMLDCIQIRAAFSRPPTEEMYETFYKRARELGVDE